MSGKIYSKIIKGKYFDSVSLMRVSKRLSEEKGVHDSSIVMGTDENKAILQVAGLLSSELKTASENDLLLAIRGEESVAHHLLDNIEQFLAELKSSGENKLGAGGSGIRNPKSLEKAKTVMADANMVMISIAGKYAAIEARKALDMGMHVMLFSDNIPIEKEVELKRYAKNKGLLLMGPDCGTAIIGGVPLAFANVVKRGNIGVVAASGTGLQEVTTLISNWGGGISEAIGTGGRDVKKEVGGLMFIEAIRYLINDRSTKVILLIAKPPHPEVMDKILKVAQGKPIVSLFLGDEKAEIQTLEQAAREALLMAGVRAPDESSLADLQKEARDLLGKISLKKNQRYARALFSGGTFASETQVLWKDLSELYSNVPMSSLKGIKELTSCHKSQGHSIVDLGDDEFTAGKPHPMIDFSTRVRRIQQDVDDASTAVILLDIVLGYGSHLNPLAEIVPVLQKNRGRVLFVASVTGTEGDPQVRSQVVAGLKEAGVVVKTSNAEASRLVRELIRELER